MSSVPHPNANRISLIYPSMSWTSPVSTFTMQVYSVKMKDIYEAMAYPGVLFGGGSTNSVEDRENGYLGVVTPSQGFWRQL